ncbi:MAG: hypothetical protein KC800_30140 [Candidatus Eremiobacteraeota bacterium]|nr:hypothetical protein [Candidatus Eremiobacteraeota bacterium]
MTNHTKLLAKAAGAFGLSLIPIFLVLGVVALMAEVPALSAFLWMASPVVCFFSGLTLAITSVDSKARIALASSVTAMAFLLVGLVSRWFQGREVYATLFFLFFFCVLLIGIRREATSDGASVAPVYLKWGLGLLLACFPLSVAIPTLSIIAFAVGAFCFYLGVLKWSLELFNAARNSSGIDSESLSL